MNASTMAMTSVPISGVWIRHDALIPAYRNTTIKPLIGGLAVFSKAKLLHAEDPAYRAPAGAGPRGTVLLAGVSELVDARDLGSRDEVVGFGPPPAPFPHLFHQKELASNEETESMQVKETLSEGLKRNSSGVAEGRARRAREHQARRPQGRVNLPWLRARQGAAAH